MPLNRYFKHTIVVFWRYFKEKEQKAKQEERRGLLNELFWSDSSLGVNYNSFPGII